MKHLSLLKHLALACGLATGASLLPSCSGTTTPQSGAKQLAAGSEAVVYSYNDSASAATRIYTQAGPLPANTARALQTWLEHSTVKTFSYVYPQYYVAVPNPKTARRQVWAICTDGQGNMTGLLIPGNGVPAWDLPYIGAYKMYVCDDNVRFAGSTTRERLRDVLSETILTELANHGYDTFRLNARKAKGLTEDQYLISKPLSAGEKARIERLKKEEAEAAEAAARAAQGDKPADDALSADTAGETPAPATPDSEKSEESSEGDSASADSSEADADSADDSSSDEAESSDEEF